MPKITEKQKFFRDLINAAYEKSTKLCFRTNFVFDELDYKANTNLSGLETFLIHQTGRYVDDYASDIIISINALENMMQNLRDCDLSKPIIFALRENGVDHLEYLESNMDNYRQNSDYLEHYYRKIYALKFIIKDKKESLYNPTCSVYTVNLELKEIKTELGFQIFKTKDIEIAI